MDVNIQSIHFDADTKLLEYAEAKVKKLEQFYDRIISADIYLKFDSHSGQIKDKTAEIKLQVPGPTLFGSGTSKTFEDALDEAFESLRRQIRKHKEKVRN